MINARAETLDQKPSFKHLLGSRRCLVPANGFYEWRREGKRKIPMHIVRRDRQPFAFAGLWDMWRKPEGGELFTFTIITTQANALLRPIHDRMPVFTTSRTLSALLQPCPSDWIEAYEVSTPATFDGEPIRVPYRMSEAISHRLFSVKPEQRIFIFTGEIS